MIHIARHLPEHRARELVKLIERRFPYSQPLMKVVPYCAGAWDVGLLNAAEYSSLEAVRAYAAAWLTTAPLDEPAARRELREAMTHDATCLTCRHSQAKSRRRCLLTGKHTIEVGWCELHEWDSDHAAEGKRIGELTEAYWTTIGKTEKTER